MLLIKQVIFNYDIIWNIIYISHLQLKTNNMLTCYNNEIGTFFYLVIIYLYEIWIELKYNYLNLFL